MIILGLLAILAMAQTVRVIIDPAGVAAEQDAKLGREYLVNYFKTGNDPEHRRTDRGTFTLALACLVHADLPNEGIADRAGNPQNNEVFMDCIRGGVDSPFYGWDRSELVKYYSDPSSFGKSYTYRF